MITAAIWMAFLAVKHGDDEYDDFVLFVAAIFATIGVN